MVNPTVALLARLLGFSFGKSKAPIYHPKPPSGRLWRDLIIAKSDRTQNPYRGTSQRRATAPRGNLCWHSPSDRGKNRKNLRGRVGKLPARNVSPRAKGFLDRRSKRRFWLLLPPGAKVARARGRETLPTKIWEKTTNLTLRKTHFTCLNCNRIMNGILDVFRAI